MTVPEAPDLTITDWTDTTVSVDSDANGAGSSPRTRWQLGYGTSWGSPIQFQDLNLYTGTGTVHNLPIGTTLYFWARIQNDSGWSLYSPRRSVKTWDFPEQPDVVALTNIRQTVVHAKFTANGNGGTPILDRQIRYGLSPDINLSEQFIAGSDVDIPNLSPGQRYYFWSEVRNAVGWSPYSERSEALLRAGAVVDHLGVPHRAVPYVKENGVWKVAEPLVKIAGLWKPTS